MIVQDTIFTSESVTEGHPDKMCDQISDAVLDEVIAQDPNARVACECMMAGNLAVLGGEISANANFSGQAIVQNVIDDIGYDVNSLGFDIADLEIINRIGEQSPDISQGVNRAADVLGAGDQGLMFGFACNETSGLMPLPVYLAHRIAERLAKVRKDGILNYLRPDGKTQVSVRYKNRVPVAIETVVVSTQHDEGVTEAQLNKDLYEQVVIPAIENKELLANTKYMFNPTGRFVIGGPKGDAGLTGRKIIVDTYGGMGRHGGGAFSGKDPSKVDRSAAYMARYVANNIVAASLASHCEVQLSYAIGVPEPTSLNVFTHDTSNIADSTLTAMVRELFDLRPYSIIETLQLKRPIYKQFSAYGHFGRNLHEASWERTDRVEDMKQYIANH